ncbi:MAG: PAQR family membrane homeostasis protein TrhA [Bacteroidales bacterium]
MAERDYSRAEEKANAISHLSGAGLATAGLVLLVVYSVIRGDSWHVVSTSVFGATMMVLYLVSGLAHALKPGKAKDLFFFFDHIAIFLLIAGTYTPITLVVLRGTLGWVLFGLQWGLAIAGILMKFTRVGKKGAGVNVFFVVLYALMGWMLVIVLVPLIRTLPTMGWLWILIGGVCYSIGIYFYRKARFPFHHLVWHLLVIAGSVAHWFAIFFYVIPNP